MTDLPTPPTDPALYAAWDHAPCPGCSYENARCACPKAEPTPGDEFSAEARRRLAEAVLAAVKETKARQQQEKRARRAIKP